MKTYLKMASKNLRHAVLYTGLLLCANVAVADTPELEALREGSLKKLIFHSEAKPVSELPFTTPDGQEIHLADYAGKYVVLNFWATWCAPCRVEMPALDALQAEFGGDRFAVLPVATGRNPLPAINRFFEQAEITALPVLLDPTQALARDMAVLGLPITVVLNPEGQEIARLRGDAEWYSDSARAIVAALLAED